MKVFNRSHLFPLIILFFSFNFYAQDKPAPPIEITDPVSRFAFNKNIMQDINFMVLGDNNIKQGVTYEYNDKRTELSLNGALSIQKTHIITIDGSFSVEDGTFIFDNKDGSKKGTISLNLFLPASFGNGKFYPAVIDANNNSESNRANRAKYLNHLTRNEVPQKVLESYRILNTIIEDLGLPSSGTDKENDCLLFCKNDHIHNKSTPEAFINIVDTMPIDKAKLMKTLEKYYTNPDPNAKYADYATMLDAIKKGKQTSFVLSGNIHKNKPQDKLPLNIPEGLDVETLFKDYDKAIERAKNIDEEISDVQIKTFNDIWRSEYNTYLALSSYYERESLDIYKNDTSISNFSDRFVDTRGDLYGLKGSLNFVVRHKKGSFFMARGIITLGRGSNFEDFKKKEYVYNSTTEPLGSGTINEEEKKTGYYTKNGSLYNYGFLQRYETELYLSSKVIGIYGKFGYSKNEALQKKETLPLETGIMINLQSEKKNVVSILLFVAREDLNVHPDDDTNIGFKIGLPINIRKKEKEVEEKK